MQHMFVFTGENEYLIMEEKRRWMNEFGRKYGYDNMQSIQGTDVTIRNVLDEVSVMPFLAERRLIVIYGMIRCQKEEAAILYKSIHPNTLVLFIDQKPDKRSSGIKELLALSEVKVFAPLSGPSLSRWVAEYAVANGSNITEKASQLLIEFSGNDQGILSEELNKLSLYSGGRSITPDDVELLSIPGDEGIIWKITDLLSEGSKDAALKYAKRMLDRGGDPQGMWAILLSTLRNSISVFAAFSDGLTQHKDIADATGVHIFAVRSLLQNAKRQQEKKLYSFLEWATSVDLALKTGALRSSDEAQQELLSAIDLYIRNYP